MNIFCFSEDFLNIVRVESVLIEIWWEIFQQMNGEIIQQYRVSFCVEISHRCFLRRNVIFHDNVGVVSLLSCRLKNLIILIRFRGIWFSSFLLLRKVFYKAENEDDSTVKSLSGDKIGVNITNLKPDTVYDIRIEAYTNQGQLMIVGNLHITTLGI